MKIKQQIFTSRNFSIMEIYMHVNTCRYKTLKIFFFVTWLDSYT